MSTLQDHFDLRQLVAIVLLLHYAVLAMQLHSAGLACNVLCCAVLAMPCACIQLHCAGLACTCSVLPCGCMLLHCAVLPCGCMPLHCAVLCWQLRAQALCLRSTECMSGVTAPSKPQFRLLQSTPNLKIMLSQCHEVIPPPSVEAQQSATLLITVVWCQRCWHVALIFWSNRSRDAHSDIGATE